MALAKLFCASEFWWPLDSKSQKSYEKMIGRDFNISDCVVKQQYRFFVAFGVIYTSPHPQRRFIVSMIYSERERAYFMTYTTYYCIHEGIVFSHEFIVSACSNNYTIFHYYYYYIYRLVGHTLTYHY